MTVKAERPLATVAVVFWREGLSWYFQMDYRQETYKRGPFPEGMAHREARRLRRVLESR